MTPARSSPFFLLVTAALLSFACTRTENGVVVPESLPYVCVHGSVDRAVGVNIDIAVAFDAATGTDRVQYLANHPDSVLAEGLPRAVYALCSAQMTWQEQINFSPLQYSGLERVAMLPTTIDANANGTQDVFFFLQFPDSIVLRVYDFAATPHWIVDASFARPEHHYAIPLALWQTPSTGKTYCVFRKSNRLQWTAPTLDTLYCYDLQSRHVAFCVPAGAAFIPLSNAPVQRDSLLLLQTWNPQNGLSYGGFDDAHSYVMAYHASGDLAWADTLGAQEYICSFGPSGVDAAADLLSYMAHDTTSGNAAVCRISHATGIRSKRTAVENGTWGLTPHAGPHGRAEYLDIDERGHMIRVHDSSFVAIETRTLPVDLGAVMGPQRNGLEDYSMFATSSGTAETDVNYDDAGEFLRTTPRGQLLVIDGASLQPLAATEAFNTPLKYAFVRQQRGATSLFVVHGDDVELMRLSPTPLLTRIAAQGALRLWLAAVAVMLPLSIYGARRIAYLRQLFRLTTTASDAHGVVVIRSSGSVAMISDTARNLLAVDHAMTINLKHLPSVINDCVSACFGTRMEQRKELVLPGGEHASTLTRYLAVTAAPMRLFGRVHACVVTISDASAIVEAELRRNLLSLSLAIVHDAKNPLGNLQAKLDVLIARLRKNDHPDPAWIDGVEQMLTGNIAEVSDSLRHLLYVANADPSAMISSELKVIGDAWIARSGERYRQRNISLRNDIPASLPAVLLEPDRIGMMLRCVCDNAAQSMQDNSETRTIVFSAFTTPDTVTLRIEDNGRGMNADTLARVLNEPYFTTKPSGSGLGMKIIRKVCEEHGATLSMRSESGRGTTVDVTLPIHRSES